MKRMCSGLAVVGFVCYLTSSAVVAQELTADDFVEFWRPVVGLWEGTFERDGQSLP